MQTSRLLSGILSHPLSSDLLSGLVLVHASHLDKLFLWAAVVTVSCIVYLDSPIWAGF